ncbi:MAG: M14 family zinc carboxypeptidase [Phycisphaerae bacterium]
MARSRAKSLGLKSRTKAFSPNSAEVEEHILKVAGRFPRFVQATAVETTDEGRPIYAVSVTDPDAPADDKQHVLIVGGQHGNEESGRLDGLALIDWLVTPQAALTRRRQKIVVMPNVNPDGAERDSHLTPRGVRPNLDHAVEGATSPEGRAVEIVASELEPEVFVDMHACGGTGCGNDLVLYPWAKPYTEDDNILHAIAFDMVRAGERAGIPHITHSLSWPGWGGSSLSEPSTTIYAYRSFKSIVLLTEHAESNTFCYPAALRAAVGVARLRALLEWGNRRHPSFHCAGYPVMLLAGAPNRGVIAVGSTAAQRRKSRLAAWRQSHAFEGVGVAVPEKPKDKLLRIDYTGGPLESVGFQVRARGKMRVKSVTFDGRKVAPTTPSGADGFVTWTDVCSTFVMAAVSDFRPGRHEMAVRLG